ncbi:SRPBCC family protein [Candidatus Chloroploca asiatica]|uniref:Polyketide cyclase n=1 Tax=Candidatus Chloroploca asiatica TaxID=1506545 RepID=A0A2H3LDX0_9CHLR|nr:SRPBCC family protein [Candidatus Chloroploca asiatica]PDW00849.1 hypothetical protein A9Q02_08250 [Candidatus Chloroploca asiatica]
MISYEIAASAITTASPEQIFAVLDDFGHWPAWMPSFENVRVDLPEGSTPGPGYRFRLSGRVVHADMQVVEFTPLIRVTRFQISFPPLTGFNRCRIVPLENGQSRIERVDSIDLHGLIASLLDTTQRRRFERLADEFLEALKHRVEGTPHVKP